jgi:uncharacterized protein
MTGRPIVLVVAKAPVPGQAKTRLAPAIGRATAADLAAAALLDTLDAAIEAADRFGRGRAVLALTGDLAAAARAGELRAAARACRVIAQRGNGFDARLAAAHADAAGPDGGPVLQIGMDTPQVDADLLQLCAARLNHADAVLAPAEDGGWWLLGVRRAATAEALCGVTMSSARTGALTRSALQARGCTVTGARTLRDVDTIADARAVAALAPHTRFAAALALLGTPAPVAS